MRTLSLLAAATVALMVVAVAGAVGELTQKPSPAGCVSEDGTGGACQDGKALSGAVGVAASPDGKSVYVAAIDSDAVAIFDREPATGALTQKAGAAGCVSQAGSGGVCQDGIALDFAVSAAVSADGKSVYVAALISDAVVIFDRDEATGALTQKPAPAGCVSETGTGGGCQDGQALDNAIGVATSADGKSVYVISDVSDALAIFDRDPATGALTQKTGPAGCVSETGTGGACQDGKALDRPIDVNVSADGKSVYVASQSSDAVAIFDRDPATGELAQKAGTLGCVSETGTGGACQDGRALDEAFGVATSASGTNVYLAAAASDAIVVFDRDTATGALTQKAGTAGCISDDGTAGACADGTALDSARRVAVSADGGNVYVPAGNSDAVAIFDRDPTTGALTQKAGTAGCVSETAGPCQDGTALLATGRVAVSGDDKSVYVTASGSNAVAIFDRATPPPPPPPAPPPGPPPLIRDRVAPVVSGFGVVPGRFRVAASAAPRGSRFRFRLSERATARILVERTLLGRRVGRRCLQPTRKLRKRSRCTRFVRAGTLTYRNRPAGQNSILFRGRIGRRALRLGSYRATISVTDPAGNRSRARRASFRIVRR